MSKRNPLKDQVAIVGVGSAPYGRDLGRSLLDLGLEAARNAIIDAGIEKEQIDGLCGNGMGTMVTHNAGFLSVQGALGIPKLDWVLNGWLGSQLVYCAQAVFAGGCDYCLIVQADLRSAGISRSAANDPFRRRAAELGSIGMHAGHYSEAWVHSGEPYAAWINRYMHDYGAPREMLGMVAINNRQWASQNPAAAMRVPFTMEDYLSARIIREPLGMLDMDFPVDCAEALLLTTAERARDLAKPPVYIHALSLGGTEIGEYYENTPAWNETAPWVAMERLWPRSDLTLDDIDLFYPYDGYTPLTIAYTEAAGFAPPGGTWDLFQDAWDEDLQKLKLRGRTWVSTGGGSMSHGRMGGFNYYGEAVQQLRGEATDGRQVDGAKTALLGIGSFFHDPAAVILRAD
jgi:acetyl-CoA acetyltransferase